MRQSFRVAVPVEQPPYPVEVREAIAELIRDFAPHTPDIEVKILDDICNVTAKLGPIQEHRTVYL